MTTTAKAVKALVAAEARLRRAERGAKKVERMLRDMVALPEELTRHPSWYPARTEMTMLLVAANEEVRRAREVYDETVREVRATYPEPTITNRDRLLVAKAVEARAKAERAKEAGR